jgi:transcription-repair coupling factor (superfamily II helicase)
VPKRNDIRIKWIATHLESKISERQDDWLFHFGSTIRLLSIQTFHQVLQFVQKNSSICKMKEKQTPAGLIRLLLTM